ncbi:unnamed protein product [Linum trigynum]|uniref:Uncharacterized protein n=1 Tax=Linum trigynum TaxID=586398 RepID=A0AAV2DYC3_9ROSI
MRDFNGDGERRPDGGDGERKKISTALMERGKGVATEAVALEREKVDLERGDGGERERRWRRELRRRWRREKQRGDGEREVTTAVERVGGGGGETSSEGRTVICIVCMFCNISLYC